MPKKPNANSQKVKKWRNALGEVRHYPPRYSFLNKGKAITSLIAGLSVSTMTRRSIPIPMPAVGGIPLSKAVKKSSSTPQASSSPIAFLSAYNTKKILKKRNEGRNEGMNEGRKKDVKKGRMEEMRETGEE